MQLNRNAYIIVTDLHWTSKNLSGRYNYQREIEYAREKIVETVLKYKSFCSKTVLVFLGDLYHNSYSDIVPGIVDNNRMIQLRMLVDDIVSVVGNHEFSYYSDNPFWTLFTKLESNKIKTKINKTWQPRGVVDIIRVVDELIDGDVRFIFNHYGCGIERPPIDGKLNIGLIHQDLYSKAIVEDLKASKGVPIYEYNPIYFDQSSVLYGYDRCYLGHAHMLYGKWKYVCNQTNYTTYIEYLSTLGRTNHLEVQDNFLERNIPVIIVENGKFVRQEDNFFNLLSREECVNEKVIQTSKNKREEYKETKELRQTRLQLRDDPIENLRENLKGYPPLLAVLDDLVESGDTRFSKSILTEFEELISNHDYK